MVEGPAPTVSREIVALFHNIAKQTHASTAITLAARLEQSLTWVIQNQMQNLSGTLEKDIFGDRGSLSTFGAKIDVAYAFGFIRSDLRQRLHAVRRLRNRFAHSDDPELHFESPQLEKDFSRLSNSQVPPKARLGHFCDVTSECAAELLKALEVSHLIKAVRNRSTKE